MKGGAIFSKNRFFGTTHGDAWNSRLRSPSLIMAPGFGQPMKKKRYFWMVPEPLAQECLSPWGLWGRESTLRVHSRPQSLLSLVPSLRRLRGPGGSGDENDSCPVVRGAQSNVTSSRPKSEAFTFATSFLFELLMKREQVKKLSKLEAEK